MSELRLAEDVLTKLTTHRTHRGWYSFIVTTLAQAIYMFGFVQLVPQLIINYKLKSVAHIPWAPICTLSPKAADDGSV